MRQLNILHNVLLLTPMRTKLPGFDPFYNGWEAYTEGGLAAVNEIEAPLLMLAVDQADPELAERVAAQYAEQGLRAADLRFGIWPDASPIPVREDNEVVGIHLDTFGGRQVRYREATEPERAAIDAVTYAAELLVVDAVDPEHGTAIYQFGKIPTYHKHVVGRERQPDGLNGLDVKDRTFIDLTRRREMRDRLAPTATKERIDTITEHVTSIIRRFAA